MPGEGIAAQIVADPAVQILALDDRIKRLDKQIHEVLRTHPEAEIIKSLPGMRPIRGVGFVVAAGDITSFTTAGSLASAAGTVAVPRVSGRRTGNLHQPKLNSRRLRQGLYLSARTSIIREEPDRDLYRKKRGKGNTSRRSPLWSVGEST
ncbi:transposase [Streptomyces sp. x-80]|uniref:transposase n=1 Tax=Streptomyces sp. x-80 TaxID=2789282 RepID=UPI00397FCA94